MRMARMTYLATMLVAMILVCASCAGGKNRSGLRGDSLPPEFARVLREYEEAWREKDAEGLAELFAEDGLILPHGSPPVHGRAAIERHYSGAGGPLWLRSLAWDQEESVGYIIGEYSHMPDFKSVGKFTLTLKKDDDDRWWIMSDMDNSNRRQE